ncbi:MAG: LemA family protein [Methanomethylovorans sp.]|uniref:LemA family protein n=1 Tax=Methanomethylovorans sp. TaxID=2758717 RepID=UPI003C76FFC0
MTEILWSIGVILVIALIIAVFVFSVYNKLVTLRNRVENAWAQVDVQLKRRFDLIPNIVETVKGYAKHETSVFEEVTKARSAWMSASTVNDAAQASNMLTNALKSLFAVSEDYPELKANENFRQLQQELSQTEDKIAYSRQFYNDTVMKYNISIQRVPNNIIAGMFNFEKKELLEIEEEEKIAPKVDFRS